MVSINLYVSILRSGDAERAQSTFDQQDLQGTAIVFPLFVTIAHLSSLAGLSALNQPSLISHLVI